MPLVQPAIPAAKNPLGDALIYYLLMRWSIWNSFDRVWLQVVGPLPHPDQGPLIVYLNHPSWWDGYMAALINRMVLHQRFAGYLMMEERQLRLYRFMSWSGAFSVDRHDRREAARSVEYISRLLHERRHRALYIFPQGELTPNDRRPLRIYPGIAHIARRAGGALLCPVGLRYEFRGEQRPEAFIRLGPCHRMEVSTDTDIVMQTIGQRLNDNLEILRNALLADDITNFRILLHGRPGIDRLFDPIAAIWSGYQRMRR